MLGILTYSQAMRGALVPLLQSSSSLFYGMTIPTEPSAVSGAWVAQEHGNVNGFQFYNQDEKRKTMKETE